MASEKPIRGKCGSLITKWKNKFGKKMYCTRPAGWGTSRPGSGRCRFHGGTSTGPKSGTAYLAKLVQKEKQQLIEMYRELPEEERWGLENVLAIEHIVLGEILRRKKYNLIPRLGESIRRIVETLRKEKYGSEVKIHINVIIFFVEKVVELFNECNELATAEERRTAFTRGLETALLAQRNSLASKEKAESRAKGPVGASWQLGDFKTDRN